MSISTVEKGRIAEAKVVAELTTQGYEVYMPTFGNGVCDLIACRDAQFIRVETKYVTGTGDVFQVALRQVRANRAAVVVKKFDAANSDVLAVFIAPLNRVAFLPSKRLHGRSGISLRVEMLDDYAVFASATTAALPKQHGGNQFTVAARASENKRAS